MTYVVLKLSELALGSTLNVLLELIGSNTLVFGVAALEEILDEVNFDVLELELSKRHNFGHFLLLII